MYEKISEEKERLKIIKQLKDRMFVDLEHTTDALFLYLIDSAKTFLADENDNNKNSIILLAKKITEIQKAKGIIENFTFMVYHAKYDEFDKIEYVIPTEILDEILNTPLLLDVFTANAFCIENEQDIVDIIKVLLNYSNGDFFDYDW